MPNRTLAVFLFASMAAVIAVLLAPMLMLAAAHKPYLAFLPGMLATMPGFLIASMAWRGKLTRSCARSSWRPHRR